MILPEIRFEQVLLGYSKGHQILAASVELPVASARQLRTATDMAFEGGRDRYFTVTSLDDSDFHAFAMTWPGEDWQRPGAVWAHVLLLDHLQLSRLNSLDGLLSRFVKPTPATASDFRALLARYSHPAEASFTPPYARNRPFTDRDFAAAVLERYYDTAGPVTLGLGWAPDADELVLSMLCQQWPSLRRKFSARSRARSSHSAWDVGLELVEKPAQSVPASAVWARRLAADLVAPSDHFRSFLNRYGPESSKGKLDMPSLVRLYGRLSEQDWSPERTISHLRKFFPDPDEMKLLKRDLVGEKRGWAPKGWPEAEVDRLMLAFELGSAGRSVDMQLGVRLARVVKSSGPDSRLKKVQIANLSVEQAEELLTDLVSVADFKLSRRLAVGQPDLGLLLATRRAEVLADPQFWPLVDADLAASVFIQHEPEQQKSVLRDLLQLGATEPLTRICERSPDTWWDLLFVAADNSSVPNTLMRNADVLRSVLDRVGSAAIGRPQRSPKSPAQTLLLLLSADLVAGLWRRCGTSTWSRLASMMDDSSLVESFPMYVSDRVYAVSLLSAGASTSAVDRVSGWKNNFAQLHFRLAHSDFDGEAWRALSTFLPSSGEEWDRCQRLRRGLIAEIKRDQWLNSNVEAVTLAAGPFGAEITSQVAPEPTPRTSILRTIIGHLFS